MGLGWLCPGPAGGFVCPGGILSRPRPDPFPGAVLGQDQSGKVPRAGRDQIQSPHLHPGCQRHRHPARPPADGCHRSSAGELLGPVPVSACLLLPRGQSGSPLRARRAAIRPFAESDRTKAPHAFQRTSPDVRIGVLSGGSGADRLCRRQQDAAPGKDAYAHRLHADGFPYRPG